MRACDVFDDFLRLQLDQGHRLAIVCGNVVHLPPDGHGGVVGLVLGLIETVDVLLV